MPRSYAKTRKKAKIVHRLSHSPMLSPTDGQHRLDAALAWLRRSIEACRGQGSSHSWSPLFGWAGAYPETTGYLIETLLDCAELKQDHELRSLAFSCADWLLSIQMPDGAFAGLLAGHRQPSVFNTSQILFGLARVSPENEEAKKGLARAVQWLLDMLETDYAWRRHAYVEGFVPSYYSRAVWGVLKANQVLRQPETEQAMRQALQWYAGRLLPNGSVRDWGFRPGAAAFTHTIGYTFEGFLESALLLDDKDLIEKKILAGDKFLTIRNQAGGRTAGRYDEQWQGDYSFLCVTGNCQLSLFFQRLWEISGEPRFREAARSLLAEVLPFQYLGKNKNRYGALPGSAPVWGPYQRFRYPNWGVKFFLDALLRVGMETAG